MSIVKGKIITVSERGQITIPQSLRDKIPVKHFICEIVNGKISLSPLQTRDEFFQELEQDEKEWSEKGGHSFEEVMQESKKLS